MLCSKGYSLLLLDEFARGTNPVEGTAIYHATLSRLSKKADTVTLSATHYDLPQDIENITHFQTVGFDETYYSDVNSSSLSLTEKLQMINSRINYQPIEVEKNKPIPHSAIVIAEILGLDSEIINKAKTTLKKETNDK
jgi:DNA mismatch repair ATPase MutS